MKVNPFKIGDVVVRTVPTICHRPDTQGGTITSISQCNKYIRFNGARDGWEYESYKHVSALDLTKPLQQRKGTLCRLIGKLSNGNIIVEVNGRVCEKEPDGRSLHNDAEYDVINVPPAPVWPRKKYFAVFMKKDTPCISGPCNERHTAEEIAKPHNGCVQEVTFNGPQA